MSADIGAPLALIDHHGRPVSEAAFRGRPALLYFGYSFCPDICPTTLQTLTEAMAAAGGESEVAGVFVTVDPERDTAEHLAGYVAAFESELVGLTGDAETIDRLARAFRVYYRLRKEVDPEAYPVDHSSYIYLMDADWRPAAVFRDDATPDQIAAAIRRLS